VTYTTVLGLINYGLVLIYGLILSVDISGGWSCKKQRNFVIAAGFLFFIVQTPLWLFAGVDYVKKIYPLIVHVPLTLILIFVLKKRVSTSVLSVLTGYLCCQIPRWFSITVSAFTDCEILSEISYTIVIIAAFFILRRFFVKAANSAITASKKSMFLFGSLPAVYYFFDYATVIYSDMFYAGTQMINEFLPTVIIMFYMIFISLYHIELREKNQIELQNSILKMQLKQSEVELNMLSRSQEEMAMYRHDIRHHFVMLIEYLKNDNPQKALEYINSVYNDIEKLTPKKYCKNNSINLIFSYFENISSKAGIKFTAEVNIFQDISFPETEICTLLSNGIENAVQACARCKDQEKWICIRGKITGHETTC